MSRQCCLTGSEDHRGIVVVSRVDPNPQPWQQRCSVITVIEVIGTSPKEWHDAVDERSRKRRNQIVEAEPA